MNHSLTKLCLLLSLLGGGATFTLHGQTTAFTYQGLLTSGGEPASGRHDFRFTLFALESGGSPSSDPVVLPAVGVTNGLFTVALDFGADAFTGMSRWLDIAVRPAGGGAFVPLNPRQPITSAPLALTALNAFTAKSVPGVSGNALHAAEGGPTDAVMVDNAGKVGVGTTTPASQFHVVSQPDAFAPPRLQSTGNTRFNAGWDFYHGDAGRGYVGVPDANAPIAPGEMVLFGGADTQTSLWAGGTRGLTVNLGGRVGIGTTVPKAALDVRGDVILGPGGEFSAVGAEENLRIVRGRVGSKGQVVAGSGFQVIHQDGTIHPYIVTFIPRFSAPPTVSGSVARHSYITVPEVTADHAKIFLIRESTVVGEEDFQFIAIGPR